MLLSQHTPHPRFARRHFLPEIRPHRCRKRFPRKGYRFDESDCFCAPTSHHDRRRPCRGAGWKRSRVLPDEDRHLSRTSICPSIYVVQPYGGMDPAQMEGLLTFHYENHFLYISGIHHVESQNIQGFSQMKIFFHPGTDMVQAMAEVVAQVNRARSFMPPGTVPPFVVRFDAGSAAGRLHRPVEQDQDASTRFRRRPTSASGRRWSACRAFRLRRRSAATSEPSSCTSIRTGCAPIGCRPTTS